MPADLSRREPTPEPLRCSECNRPLDALPSCGIVHAITALQITVLRQFVAAALSPNRRSEVPS